MATEEINSADYLPLFNPFDYSLILQNFYLINYVYESYFLLDLDLLNTKYWLSTVNIRTRCDFLFLLFYFSYKYKLEIRFIEEDISSIITEVKLYSEKNLEFYHLKRFQTNNRFILVYLSFKKYIKEPGIKM